MKALFLATGLIVTALATPAFAGDVIVQVANIATDKGEVGCALFTSAQGFPLQPNKDRQQWHPACGSGVTCRFTDLPAGTYAIAVSHDLNGNKRTDRNFIGLPTEAWGVTNNIRPSLRAPRFDEARFVVRDGQPMTLQVRVAR